jgi:hypothetical protein
MHRSPMVQADSLITGTCYWSASYAELGGDRRIEAAGRFLAALRELPAAQLFETLEAPPEHRRWRSVPPKSADHLGITVNSAPVPPPGDHIALVCGGACCCAQPAPGCPDINQFGKDRGTGGVPVRLARPRFVGWHTLCCTANFHQRLTLFAGRNNEGRLELAGEVPASFAAWQRPE